MRFTFCLIFIIQCTITFLNPFAGNVLAQTDTNDKNDYFIPFRIGTENRVLSENIKSVTLSNGDWEFGQAVINISKKNKLFLSFDELGNKIRDYRYTIQLCNDDWTLSDMLPLEYIDGMPEESISQTEISRNTLTPYVHYEANIPGDNFRITRSGNYIVKVYLNENGQDNPSIIKRFYVSEQALSIQANVMYDRDVELRDYRHELDFEINTAAVNVENSFNNINVVVMQNGRFDNLLAHIKPNFVNGNIMDFHYNRQTIFDANNEYRHFDIRSLNYNTDRIREIKRDGQDYHVFLKTDIRRPFMQYVSTDDLNGRFYISNDANDERATESEYAYVHFSLKYDAPVEDGALYISGQFTDYNYLPEFKMEYNYGQKCYEKTVLLKQGYYDYQYTLLPNNSRTGDASFIEGRHSEAGNEYSILVYYTPPGERCARLLHYLVLNSKNSR